MIREGRLTVQDGLAIAWRDHDGPPGRLPLLCLAGLGRNGRDFADRAREWRPDRRVVTMDYRGRGLSDRARDWRAYRTANDLLDIRQLTAALGLARVIVVGTSYGGLLGMVLAALQPRLVAGLVMNDIGPETGSGARGRIAEYLGRPHLPTDWADAERHLQEIMPDMPLSAEGWRSVAEATYREDERGRPRPDWDPAIARAVLETAGTVDLRGYFRALARLPLLVFRGERSTVLEEPALARMQAALPHMEAVTVAGFGHAPTLGEPECRRALMAFFERVEGAERPSPLSGRGPAPAARAAA